ncbi:MAG: hypothetical protein ACREPN_00995 [Rudaea sp.]
MNMVADTTIHDATLDRRLRDFVLTAEVDGGSRFVDALFRRKYADDAPRYPHHLATFCRRADGSLQLAHYLHFFDAGGCWLIGGACTDGDMVRALPPGQRDAIRVAGGLMLQATRYGLCKFGPQADAVFGHCGDARSFQVLMQAGFQPVDHPHLVVYWPRALPAARVAELIAKAEALGEF